MKCSHNELASLIKKAAIGKGFPEGLAKELAYAALCLSGQQAEAALSGLTTDKGWSVVKNGPALFDQAFMALSSQETDLFKLRLEHVDSQPLLEGMSRAAAVNYGLVITFTISNDITEIAVRLGNAASPPLHSGAIEVSSEVYQALNAFAEKTYVPASAASRLKGAGAGLNDND